MSTYTFLPAQKITFSHQNVECWVDGLLDKAMPLAHEDDVDEVDSTITTTQLICANLLYTTSDIIRQITTLSMVEPFEIQKKMKKSDKTIHSFARYPE